MRRLSDEEFKATHVPEPEPVDLGMAPPFDFWEYFEAIPSEHFGGHDFSAGRVPYAWHMRGTGFQHVLVGCETPNVFLVLVLDVSGGSVAGHHLLDLNRVYGLA